MAAPTVVRIESTQLGASVLLPASGNVAGPAAGDLAVVVQEGLQTSGSVGSPFYTDNNGPASAYNQIIKSASTPSGNGRIVAYWKILTSSDFTGGNFRQLTVQTATFSGHRAQLFIFNHPRGWDSTLFADASSNGNIAVDTAISLTDFTREGVVVVAHAVATNATTQTVAWDGGTARDPYCDESSSTTTTGGHSSHYGTSLGNDQSDYNEYASGTTATSYAMHVQTNNASHVFLALQFRVAPPTTVTGTGLVTVAATTHGDARITVGATALVTPAVVVHSTSQRTLAGTGRIDGAVTVHGERQGTTTVTGTALVTAAVTVHGQQAQTGTGRVDGTVTVHGDGTRTLRGTGNVTGTVTVHGDQQTITTAIPAGGTWSTGGGLIRGGDTVTGTAAITVTATTHGDGHKLQNGQGNAGVRPAVVIGASGTVTVNGTAAVTITADVAGSGFAPLPRVAGGLRRRTFAKVEVI